MVAEHRVCGLTERVDVNGESRMKYTRDTTAPPSQERVIQLEGMLCISFPADFIEFLNENNGGVPLLPCFDTSNNTKVIERFLPIMERERYKSDEKFGIFEIGVVWSQINDRLGTDPDEYGSQITPIAELFAGDMLCLDFRNNEAVPEIVVWDHEQSKDLKPVVEKVADSFAEFLTKLQPLDENE
jgi:hypothetical protein